VRDSMSSSSRAALGPRSCSGDGDGRGRTDPLRGGGDNTVICCGERSGTEGSGGLYELREGGRGGGSGNENCDSTREASPPSSSDSAVLGDAVATGVSMSRLRKSASGAMCAIRAPIGIAGTPVGISSGGSTGGAVGGVGGGGGVARPEGALSMRRRCLSDDARGSSAVAGVGIGIASGGGGNGRVGGGLGGMSNAGGMT
jgi:hypothetical protein